MQIVHAVVECPVQESFRARQVAGMFDLPVDSGMRSSFCVKVPTLDEPWSIGAIVGPSGSGKTTVAKRAFGPWMPEQWDWPASQSILEGFPGEMEIRQVTQLLGSVGFSSPPAWMRPFHLLSNGEQFRVTLARTLAELPELAVVDEFTSVVDRTVAKIGSAAVSRAVRRSGRRFVAVSCHYDILPWLEPDWVVDMGNAEPQPEARSGTPHRLDAARPEGGPPLPNAESDEEPRGWLRRPDIRLEIVRCDTSAWKIFNRHHYLSGKLHSSAICFAALIEDQPAAFVAALPFPHATHPGWREHRCVCLPDYQGVGIGNTLSEFVASLFVATGRPYTSVTSHPAMMHHRSRSPLWRVRRGPSRVVRNKNRGGVVTGMDKSISSRRMTASFKFVGAPRFEESQAFGLLRNAEVI
jgi:energy-coupling factor transporter ATP-binding protein EcfA2